MADTRLPVLDAPDDTTYTRLSTAARVGSDASLALRDRRDRAAISDRTNIVPGTIVAVGGERMRLLSPGRGNGWMLLAWTDGGNDCYGTFHESHLTPSQEAPRDEPVLPTRAPTAPKG